MAIELWLKENDKGRFESVCDGVELKKYLDSNILTGELTGNNIGKLSALGKKFVLGRKGKENDKVYILNNSPFRELEMTQTLGYGILIMGDPNKEDFIKRVFGSYYYKSHVPKRNEKANHFILYHTIK